MKYIKKFFSIVLIITLFIVNSKVSAKTLSELRKEVIAAEAKYNKNQSDKKQTEEEIAATNEKIVSLNREREQVQNDINDINEDLESLAKDIQKMQQEIKSIVHYYQLSSSNSLYLEYVFNASNFTDFIYRLAVTEQLSEYREKTINQYNNLMEQNRKKLNELAEKQVSLDKLQEEVSNQLTKLGNNLSSITEEAVDIKDEIDDLKKQINTYETKYKCSDNEQLTSCVNRYNNAHRPSTGGGSYSGVPSANGFYRPITSGALNYEYGYTAKYGAYHDGIDFTIPHGTPVYSVADGIVVSIKPRQRCGGNMIYIAHTLNGKTYTSAYFHLAEPIKVSVGQYVTHNTMIGYSGGVHAIEWWDSIKCSTGAHLHFQIATGIYTSDYLWYSNFKSRSFNPRIVINFPPTDVRFNGR